jgi:hypothetical protein
VDREARAAKLRTSDKDAADGAKHEIARIVAQIRARWPEVEIILRADFGFARDDLLAWCEENGVDYIFGLARERAPGEGDPPPAGSGPPREPSHQASSAPLFKILEG